MFTQNIDDGYPEALCRNLRKGFLMDAQYAALKQTSNIGEFRLTLEDTDYGSDIFALQDGNDFEVQVLRKAMKERVMSELTHIMGQSVYPLTQFLTMMLHKYQIENVVFIIEGLKGNRSIEELIRTADPLGYFPGMKNIQPIEGDDYASLYQTVLIDLPVGLYFRKFLNEITASAASDANNEIDAKFISEMMKDYSL